MIDIDDWEPPSYVKAVNVRVTLDMLTNEQLTDEMVRRGILTVITAKRTVPRIQYVKTDFYSAIRAILSCDIAKRLVECSLIGEDMVRIGDDLQFYSQAVLLNTVHDDDLRAS